AILTLERRGFRHLEIVIGAMVGTIALCYLIEVFIAPIAWRDAAAGLVTPRIPDAEALTIAVGIIGATVMPHALFLHSGLTQH
ncbi:divalent metal cation transporter, partial [Raoultella ornithinolytica]